MKLVPREEPRLVKHGPVGMPSTFGASAILNTKFSIYCSYSPVGTKSAKISSEINQDIEKTELQDIEKTELKVYPNPFSDKLRFTFVAPESVNARIDIYDLTGRIVNTVFEQPVERGVRYEAEFRPEADIDGMYIYRITMMMMPFTKGK